VGFSVTTSFPSETVIDGTVVGTTVTIFSVVTVGTTITSPGDAFLLITADAVTVVVSRYVLTRVSVATGTTVLVSVVCVADVVVEVVGDPFGPVIVVVTGTFVTVTTFVGTLLIVTTDVLVTVAVTMVLTVDVVDTDATLEPDTTATTLCV